MTERRQLRTFTLGFIEHMVKFYNTGKRKYDIVCEDDLFYFTLDQ